MKNKILKATDRTQTQSKYQPATPQNNIFFGLQLYATLKASKAAKLRELCRRWEASPDLDDLVFG